jgi:hypothetical protein
MNENLKKLGIQKKKGKIVNFISPHLVIRHKPTKIEYTIKKIKIDNGKPIVYAYRYYSKPSSQKKVFVTIEMKDFKEYEPV